jgi:hypothetical protein
MPKIGCSADQVYSQDRQCADNWRPSCSCAASVAEVNNGGDMVVVGRIGQNIT